MASQVSGVSMARVTRVVVKVVKVHGRKVVISSTFKCTPILPPLVKNHPDCREEIVAFTPP